MSDVHADDRVVLLERENTRLRRMLGELPSELPPQPFRALVFQRGDEQLALPVAAVREVVHAVWPEPVADAPRGVRGRFLYEGELVTLVDLALCASDDPPSPLEPSMIIVIVDHGTGLLALLGDRFLAVQLLEPSRAIGLSATPSPFHLASFPDAPNKTLHLLSARQIAFELSR